MRCGRLSGQISTWRAEATLSGWPGRAVMAGWQSGRGGWLARDGGVAPGAAQIGRLQAISMGASSRRVCRVRVFGQLCAQYR